MPRVSRSPRLLPLLCLLVFGGCAYLFPSCETIPDCPDAEVPVAQSDAGRWVPTKLCNNLTCSDLHTDPFNCGACNNECAAGLSCLPLLDGGAACGCAVGGQTLVNGSCFAFSVDPRNCGGLGNVCPTNHVCFDGGCVCPNPDYLDGGPLTECPGDGGDLICVDLEADPGNCGACGEVCDTGDCQAGVCADAGAFEPDGGDDLGDGGDSEPDAGDAGDGG